MLVLVVPVLQVDTQRVVPLAGYLVDVLVAQPELAAEVPEALLVLVPGPIEVNRAVLTPLDDRPAPTCRTERKRGVCREGP